MGISKKLRNKRKRNLITVLFGTAILTSMMAIIKVSGVLILEKETVKLSSQQEVITEYQNSNSLTGITVAPVISAGNTFGVALKTDGTVWTWGNNTYGQLGNGEIGNVNIEEPTRVLAVDGNEDEENIRYLENIKQISAGAYTVSALTSDGKVVSWGRNEYGQLANGLTANSGVPVYVQKQVEVEDEEGNITKELVDLDNIVSISQGSSHVLALANDGTVWSWGLNKVEK